MRIKIEVISLDSTSIAPSLDGPLLAEGRLPLNSILQIHNDGNAPDSGQSKTQMAAD